jgi:hypothetical protein
MSLAFSTGPLENQVAGPVTSSAVVWTKVLNNSDCLSVQATVKVFKLNGSKTLIQQSSLTVEPLASHYVTTNVASAFEFEVQIGISPREAVHDVLISVWGKDASGNLNPSHRLVPQELTPIPALTPTDDQVVWGSASERTTGDQPAPGEAGQ